MLTCAPSGSVSGVCEMKGKGAALKHCTLVDKTVSYGMENPDTGTEKLSTWIVDSGGPGFSLFK